MVSRPIQVARWVVLGLFLLSGSAGLMHEIAWTRLLRLVMGNTTHSIAVVLGVFMAGLALGSFVGGRLVDRRSDPLRVFGLLEAGVGLYCLLLPWLIQAIGPIYKAIYETTYASPMAMTFARLTLSAALLLIPATLMGATLPALTRWYAQSVDQTGRSAGRLYAFNSLGAVFGVFFAGVWLIPSVGVWWTVCTAAGLNLSIGVAACILHQYWSETLPAKSALGAGEITRTAADLYAPSKIAIGVLLAGYALSGLAAMVYQIAWTRVLTLMIGSSVYAFSLILTAFILGLACGSLTASRWVDRWRLPLEKLAWIQFSIGASSLLVVPLLGAAPVYATGLIFGWGDSFWKLQAAEFALVLGVMIVPTFLMGAAFPLVTRVFADWSESVGRSVGTVYAFNTIGAILGSLLGGFVLIPWLGIQSTIFAAVAVSLCVGCGYLLVGSPRSLPVRAAFVAAVAAASIFGMGRIPRWDAAAMTFGPFVQAVWLNQPDAASRESVEKLISAEKTLFYREGLTSTVAVKQSEKGVLTLLTNGRVEASSRGGEAQQRLLAHIPLLLHPNPRDVLTIGLASGVTLDAAARHPVETLDCVEISDDVIGATRLFHEANRNVLDDPRLRMVIADGRNHLALTDRRYDVIVSQPSDPAMAGVADLFTQEFFQNAYDRLNDRGLVCIWLKASSVDEEVFRSIVATFGGVFDDVTIWSATKYSEFLLVGSRGEMKIDHRLLAERLAAPHLAEDMKLLGIDSIPDLMYSLVTGREGALRFAGAAPRHTDDNSLLEFSAPRSEFERQDPGPMVDALLAARDQDISFLIFDPQAPGVGPPLHEVKEQANRHIQARALAREVVRVFAAGEVDRAMELLIEAAKLNPDEPEIVQPITKLRDSASQLAASGKPEQALALRRQIVRILPESALDRFHYAESLRHAGQEAEAAEQYLHVHRIQPHHADGLLAMADEFETAGDLKSAREVVQRTLPLAQATGQTELIAALRQRLERYEKPRATSK